ncbi:MAG: FKBP-type peptidyl-prolyl cis-trans isomerase [Bacteroidales bacterium]|nr:FKBP-type peptidyl-prolyl cis-trans isomerase [Bacteroidales bacterium]
MKKTLIYILAAACILTGCAKTVTVTSNQAAKRYLDAWVHVQKQKHPDYLWKQTPLGSWILEETVGNGPTLTEFDDSLYLRVNYTYYSLDGDISSTTSAKLSQQLGTYVENNYYGPQIWYANSIYAGLEELVKGMKAGGRRKAVIPGWLQTSTRCETAEEYLALADDKVGTSQIFDIELVEHFLGVSDWEIDSISRYLVRHFPSVYGSDPVKARADSSGAHGFYYIRRDAPSEEKELKDTTVYINYTGRLLNGTVFDTCVRDTAMFYGIYSKDRTYGPVAISYGSEWSDCKMGAESTSVIKGFARTLWAMKPFEKGTGVFFSPLGYSYSGSGGTIPAYSPLRFDIELVANPN